MFYVLDEEKLAVDAIRRACQTFNLLYPGWLAREESSTQFFVTNGRYGIGVTYQRHCHGYWYAPGHDFQGGRTVEETLAALRLQMMRDRA